MKAAIIVLASFLPMHLGIVEGFTGCDRKLLEMEDMSGYFRGRESLRIVLPYVSVDILVGIRAGLGHSWRVIIRTKTVAVPTGLGHMILLVQQISRTDKVIVGTLVIGMVGYVTDRISALAISKLLKRSCDSDWD